MGLDRNGSRFLCRAAARGVDFTRTITVGRQTLAASAHDLAKNLTDFERPTTEEDAARLKEDGGGYAEPFLRALGAVDPRSLDYSDYEGATDLHDLNRPLPAHLAARFSAVIDGGSLEHVLHLPVALKNCMEMVEEGGHLLHISPANNLMGHGFYQLSPEFFYSTLTEANGFTLVDMFAFEIGPCDWWYRVANPREVNQRVGSVNARPVYLLVTARRTRVADVFADTPQQSDYETWWRGDELATDRPGAARPQRFRALLRRLLPDAVRHAIRARTHRPGFAAPHFTRMHPRE